MRFFDSVAVALLKGSYKQPLKLLYPLGKSITLHETLHAKLRKLSFFI
ncbi:hypothetical protein [Helicobacter pylori]|nr:hypothetical protein [Helicobacter pylori]